MRLTRRWSAVRDLLVDRGRPWPKRVDRRWLIAHVVLLAAALVILLIAARGQYFYFDEWDFLATRAEWDLLAPHVGHLSLVPQLLTTAIKSVVGLSSYWPYLLPTIAMHLVAAHLLWRVMVRSGSGYLLSSLAAVVFVVLGPGSENSLWAFQIGFITPLALGLAALLLSMRSRIGRLEIVGIAVMLLIAIASSGTAIPMILIVAVSLCVRHGWRAAIVPAAAVALPYGAWYLLFNTGPHDWDWMRVHSVRQLLVDVPQFVISGIVDSVADMLPVAVLSAPLLVLLAVWSVRELSRRRRVWLTMPALLATAALVFALLTALSRVSLGVEAASAGRYAYVYCLLLAPVVVAAATRLVRRSIPALSVLVVVLLVLIGFNASGLLQAGQEQRTVRQSVPRAMSAAIADIGCADPSAEEFPSARVAPTLSMADICSFVERGQFTPVAFTASDALDVRINVDARSIPVTAGAPDASACKPAEGDAVSFDPATELVYAPLKTTISVRAVSGGTSTEFAAVTLVAGVSRLEGLDGLEDLRLAFATGQACVFSLPTG